MGCLGKTATACTKLFAKGCSSVFLFLVSLSPYHFSKFHSIPVRYHITFVKICTHTYHALSSTQPSYLHLLLTPARKQMHCRSYISGRLCSHRFKTNIGSRSISVASPTLSNSLSHSLIMLSHDMCPKNNIKAKQTLQMCTPTSPDIDEETEKKTWPRHQQIALELFENTCRERFMTGLRLRLPKFAHSKEPTLAKTLHNHSKPSKELHFMDQINSILASRRQIKNENISGRCHHFFATKTYKKPTN